VKAAIGKLHPYSVNIPSVLRVCNNTEANHNHDEDTEEDKHSDDHDNAGTYDTVNIHEVEEVFKKQLGLRYVTCQIRKGPAEEETREKKRYNAYLFGDFLLDPENYYVVCMDESSITNDIRPRKLWQEVERKSNQANAVS
jgi:hypothetical protein